MDRWSIIRQRAADVLATYETRTKQAAFGPEAGSYARLSDIASELYQLTVVPDDELPENVSGRLDLDEGTIGYRASEPMTRQHFTIAHDLGHRALEHPPRLILEAAEQINDAPYVGALTVRDGVYRAYSEHDRWELEANVFAAELLAPVERVRSMVLGDPHWSVNGLADYFGLSRTAMLNQLAAALLPGPSPDPDPTVKRSPSLDEMQHKAATVQPPALVIAGPGAGKTSVLSRRFAYLVDQGIHPSRILALTFANKAAEEMRERLAALLPAHAHAIQVGTFHSLGLELLQSYGHQIGLRPDPQLLTEIDAFVLLRSRLGELPLGSFEDLHRPTRNVCLLLSAISRAKDELVGPQEFTQRVATWQAELDARPKADNEEDARQLGEEWGEAARCADVAAVYATYQGLLREGGYLDYGDLIVEAVRLFDIPEVAADIRQRYDHILVDEFQDINYASGRLIHALDGGRRIVWAVGDPRQSIYRFRGASPVNLREFTNDYPGAQIIALECNYRSVEGVVKAGQAVSIPQPTTGEPLPVPALRSHRGRPSDEPAVELVVAPTGPDELAALVARVREAAASVHLGHIAVLCRKTAQAQEVSDALEAAGIPTDWGGALEERGPFKDLLSVLLLAADDPQGLVRLARLAEHYLAETDLRRLLATAIARGRSALAALYAACDGEVEGLTTGGRAEAERIKALAGALRHAPTPWLVLASYLFEHAAWPRGLLADSTPAAQRRLGTLGQLANLAREFAERANLAGGGDTSAFLDFLRSSLEAGELAVSDEALVTSDAVHILTVHRSKGLEWPVVFVPNLVEGRFPLKDDHAPLPLPPGLIRGADPQDGAIEEACLFYVAATRARDRLILSRADKYGRGQATVAPFIEGVREALAAAGHLQITLAPPLPPAIPVARTPDGETWIFTDNIPFRALETYEECGQRFKYEYVYGLRGEERGYVAFHTAVYDVMSWAADQAANGTPPEPEVIVAELARRWAAFGPAGHWFEKGYRRRAERVVRAFGARLRPGIRVMLRTPIPLQIGGRTLRIIVDEVEEDGATHIYRRYHFGRPAKSHRDDDHRPALITAAHHQNYASLPHEVRLHYPLERRDEQVSPTPRVVSNRAIKMAKLVSEIEAGQFAPKPSPSHCPTCPFVFICPA